MQQPFYTYFALLPYSGKVKIGVSMNPTRRVASLHCNKNNEPHCQGFRPALIGLFVDEGQFGEEAIHERFRGQLIDHEWFEATEEVARFLAENRDQMVEYYSSAALDAFLGMFARRRQAAADPQPSPADWRSPAK